MTIKTNAPVSATLVIGTSPDYQRAERAHNIFQFWLAQQRPIPKDWPEYFIDLLESAFIAGYMEDRA